MDLKLFLTIFGSIFLAELGDKTQLATLLFASGAETPKWLVFAASASALVLTSALGVARRFVDLELRERTRPALGGWRRLHRDRCLDALEGVRSPRLRRLYL